MPNAPTGLTTISVTDTTANISWDAVVFSGGITGYEVFRDDVSVGTVTSTNYTDTGLTESSSYEYKIVAKSNNVDSAKSNALTISTIATVIPDPDAPINLTSGVVDSTSIELNWDGVTYTGGISSYDIYENGSVVGNSVTNTYTHTGLTPATTYTYTVIAIGNNGQSSVESISLTETTA